MAGSNKSSRGTILIKRIQAGGEAAHHGGAWKIAYADFVTAMMAFFLLMWLLSATTEEQRSGLAEYFSPTLVASPVYAGEDVEVGVRHSIVEELPETEKAGDFENVARQVQDSLTGTGAESLQMENILRHVTTRLTDEGLVIEVSDLADTPLFVENTAQPQPVLRELTAILSRVLSRTRNDLAVSGFVRSYPETLITSPVWALSDARAHTMRNLMDEAGTPDKRFQRITGFADRKNRDANPLSARNNRIEVILLR